jgi:predicted DNA-binding protein
MTAAMVTIKVKAGQELMGRIEQASKDLDVTPANFVEYAIERQLEEQEFHRIKEDITLEELRSTILHTGQTLAIVTEDEEVSHCQICMKELPGSPAVEGPMLCRNCLSMAKGAKLEPMRR